MFGEMIVRKRIISTFKGLKTNKISSRCLSSCRKQTFLKFSSSFSSKINAKIFTPFLFNLRYFKVYDIGKYVEGEGKLKRKKRILENDYKKKPLHVLSGFPFLLPDEDEIPSQNDDVVVVRKRLAGTLDKKFKKGRNIFDCIRMCPHPGNKPNNAPMHWALLNHKHGLGYKFTRKIWKYPEPTYWTITRVKPPTSAGSKPKIWGKLTWRGREINEEKQITSTFKRDWKFFEFPTEVRDHYLKISRENIVVKNSKEETLKLRNKLSLE